MTEISAEAEVVAHLRAVAATPPGEQSLWDCTIAAWAADLIASHQSALAAKDAENREIAMQGLADEGQAQEAYEKLTAAHAEIERLTRELNLCRAVSERQREMLNTGSYALATDAEARAKAMEGNLAALREQLRLLATSQNTTDDRNTYSDGFAQGLYYAIGAVDALSTLPASTAPATPVTGTHRHVKRGTEYVLIGIGKMQAESWHQYKGRGEYEGVDMREVAIYRSVTEPTEIWVRPREEFEDGRFETLKAAITEGK